jgi:hypothetical protein
VSKVVTVSICDIDIDIDFASVRLELGLGRLIGIGRRLDGLRHQSNVLV